MTCRSRLRSVSSDPPSGTGAVTRAPADVADEAVLVTAAAVLAQTEARQARRSAQAARAVHRELTAHPAAGQMKAWARIEQAKGMLMAAGSRTEHDALDTLFTAARTSRQGLVDLAAALTDRVAAGEHVTTALQSLTTAGPPPDPSPAPGSGPPPGPKAVPGSGPMSGAIVARVTAFIDATAAGSIGSAEILAVARVSARRLQQAFRAHLRTTPSAYLRQARLAGAHRDLMAADVDTHTVAAIARRWHFEHAGRFAAQYRAVYGRPPHHTLAEPDAGFLTEDTGTPGPEDAGRAPGPP